MAYNTGLASKIREQLAALSNVEEKEMMGGLTFMYNAKMCIGVIKDEMMCRIDPALQDACVEKNGCRVMDFTSRPMKGYIMVDEFDMESKKDFEYWIGLALDYNSRAKSAKKKAKK
jgi:TfoX/Sxy family transcriptional regulator of competence genes